MAHDSPLPAMESSWNKVLKDEFCKPYFHDLEQFLQKEQAQYAVYPAQNLIYNAFALTPFEQVKVVILGQDPYHGPKQAHGLAFSVLPGIALPPSLKNIFQELSVDLSIVPARSGDLSAWAKQGVLLMNTVLTVRTGQAHSHQNKGWETLTDVVINLLSEKREGLVFLLWGSSAKAKQAYINHRKHLILTAAHPSPLSAHRGFFGCRHFSKTNTYLFDKGKSPIDWRLPATVPLVKC